MLLRPLLQFTLKRDNARCDHSELQAPTPPSLHYAHQLSVGEHFPSCARIMYSFFCSTLSLKAIIFLLLLLARN
jgi:hypothetical protein